MNTCDTRPDLLASAGGAVHRKDLDRAGVNCPADPAAPGVAGSAAASSTGHRHLQTVTVVSFGTLIVFGCVLRFWKLSDVGLWYDELWTVVGASNRPFDQMVREWMLGDSHPPGFFLFYFAWLKLVPATEFWSRLPSAVAGVLTVAYLLWGTRRVLTRDERLIAATLVSLSYAYIFWALTVKQYSLLLLLVTVATVAYLEMVDAGRIDRRLASTMAVTSVALAYLNHFGLVYAALLFVLLLVTFRRDRQSRRRLLAVGAACAVAYLPAAPFLYLQVKYNIDGWQPYQMSAFLHGILPSLFFDDAAYVARALAVLFVVLVWRATVDPRTRQRLLIRRNAHLVGIAMLFGGFMVGLGLFKPIFYVRYFLVLAPALLIAVSSAAAAALPLNRAWTVAVVVWFCVHGAAVQFHSIDRLQREEWDKSVDFVLAQETAPDAVYVLGADTAKTEFDYLRGGDVDGVFNVRNLNFYRYYFRRRGATAIAAQLNVIGPTAAAVNQLAERFRNTRATIFILAGHHLQYQGAALAALTRVTRRTDIIAMNSTLVYKVAF